MRKTIFALAAAFVCAGATIQAQATDTSSRRADLERRFREHLQQMVRRRLELNDEQVRRLAEFDRSIEPERRRLMVRERSVRHQLRRQVERGDSADQALVGRLLDEMLVVHRERIDLMAREQREMAAFLTPVQRAKFVGLQADLRRRMEEMGRGRRGRGGRVIIRRGPGADGRRPPPPPPE